MKTFSESEQINARKIFKISLPRDEESLCELSWKDLHAERKAIRKAADDYDHRPEKDKRTQTDEERTAYDAVITYWDLLQDEFDRRSESGQKEPSGDDTPYKVTTKRSNDTMETRLFQPRKRWNEIFGREPRKVEGFKNFGEIIQHLHTGNEEKLRELRTMNTVSGTEGGFAVPEVMWSEIYDNGLEASVTMDLVTVFPMTGNALAVPAWDSSDKTKGPIGSVEGEWVGEAEAGTRKTPLLRLLTFNSLKLVMYVAASSESLQDSTALSMSLGPLMRNSLAYSLDAAVLTGTGIARPLGVMNSPATIAVSRTAAGTVSFTDIVTMVGRFLPSSLPKAVLLCSPSVHGVLFGTEVSSGSGILIMQNGKVQNIPVRVTEKLPTIASKGSAMLLDLSFYGLGLRETGRFEKTTSAQWINDVADFRLIVRGDGKPMIAKPFTPSGGGSTLSPFVILDV